MDYKAVEPISLFLAINFFVSEGKRTAWDVTRVRQILLTGQNNLFLMLFTLSSEFCKIDQIQNRNTLPEI